MINLLVVQKTYFYTSEKSPKEKLQNLQAYFKSFFDDLKPNSVFIDSSIKLSKAVSNYSTISSDINSDQANVVRLLTTVSDSVFTQRFKIESKPP